ncbi:MAG: M23 family metallopeptidase [Candidatus Micrarchaeia archaeon]
MRQMKQEVDRRAGLLAYGNALESYFIEHGLPRSLGRAEGAVISAVGDHLGVGSVLQLQEFLSSRGYRGPDAGPLRENGRLDRQTVHSLFSYLYDEQRTHPGEASGVLMRLRAAVYPLIREGRGYDEASGMVVRASGYSSPSYLGAFLIGHGYHDFRNRDLEIGQLVNRSMLFAILAFGAGIDNRDLDSMVRDFLGRAIPVRREVAPPSRTDIPRFTFPVPEANRRITRERDFYADGGHVQVGYARGSYGTHSWRSGTLHRAIDIFAREGAEVVAPLSGTVARIDTPQTSARGGYVIYLVTDDGVTFLLSHLQQIDVAPNQRVERGARIGLVGETGNTRVPHVHFSVYREDGDRRIYYNPADFIE